MWIIWLFLGILIGIIGNMITLYHIIMEGEDYFNGK